MTICYKMIYYKAWRESQARFLLSACTIAGLCAAFVLFYREGAPLAERSHTYIEYIWRIVYKGYLRQLFVLLALLLGLGGLMRERDYDTAKFTLALPVSRFRFVSVRAALGLLEVAVLSFLPALVICSFSRLIGEVYPWPQALQFGVLWTVGGAFLFTIGFFASILFTGEYTAAVAAVIIMIGYSVLADLPFLEGYAVDIHDVMSGVGMPYFRLDIYQLTGPLPWRALSVFVLFACSFIALAGRITQRQDF